MSAPTLARQRGDGARALPQPRPGSSAVQSSGRPVIDDASPRNRHRLRALLAPRAPGRARRGSSRRRGRRARRRGRARMCQTPPTASAVISRRSGPRRSAAPTRAASASLRPRLTTGPRRLCGAPRAGSRSALEPRSSRASARAPRRRCARGSGSQPERARGAARVGDVVALIAGAPIGEGRLDRRGRSASSTWREELAQADGVRRAAAEIEGAALRRRRCARHAAR